jgi:formylglycine-generating enzyme
MPDTPPNTPRDNATGSASTGATASGDLSGITEMFGLRDGQQADTGTRTGTDTVGRWVAATAGADQPPDVSSRLVHGRYRLIAELGVGGMGVTYRAWDTTAGIPVVVKMPRREVRQDSEAMQRFAREIDAMLAVPHERIVPITDHGDDDGCPFVVMRFLPGGSLADYRRRDEAGNAIRNPPGMLHFWLPGVAAALDHIHSKAMLHRDVKPGNIFLDGFLKPYLGDFGIAKVVDESGGLVKEQTLTATKMAVGTPEYMAPELFKPRSKPDGQADQYALAVTVYEMLSGEKPFKGDRAHIIVEHSALPVPPLSAKVPGLPQSLCMAVERALSKNAVERFTTCSKFAAAVLADLVVLPPEADTVRLLCPSCKNILKLPQKAAGRTGKCPRCQAEMDVAADLGSLWLESEERGGEASEKVQAGASAETPLADVAVEKPRRRLGIKEWAALSLAACGGLIVGYPWGVSMNAAKAQRELREAESSWQSERAKLGKAEELLAGQNRELATERDELRKAEELMAGQNRQLETERDELRKAEELKAGQNRHLETEREELRKAKEALAADNRRLADALVAARAAKPPAPLETFTNSIGIELIQIPKGEFMMGEGNKVRVTLSRDFWLGKTEVTRGQWIRLMGTAPFGELMGNGASAGNTAGVLPATRVTWEEATEFCRKLTERERANGRLPANEVYRLPTEAEWEYACRAETTTSYSFGNDASKLGDFGWFDGNASGKEHPVGMRKDNLWGLYDMHGNAREWCSDWYDGKLAGGVDPEGPAGGSYRVHRGGGWKDDPVLCRSADRKCVPSLRNDDLGFRVARSQSVK